MECSIAVRSLIAVNIHLFFLAEKLGRYKYIKTGLISLPMNDKCLIPRLFSPIEHKILVSIAAISI